MSKDCKKGIEYGCPHIDSCISDEGTFSSANSQDPHLIYTRAKDWSKSTRTWVNGEDIYSCQPKDYRRTRNIEIMFGETFYELDMKEEKSRFLDGIVEHLKKFKE